MIGKVFGIGLSKTGTTSLYAALAELGYRSGTFRHSQRLGLERWVEGDFGPDYLAEFDAMTDLPIGCFFRELDLRYPGSRFILTTRSLEPWLASVARQFRANPEPTPFNRDTRLMAYGVSVFNEGMFRRAYLRHEAEVRDHFATRPNQLLVVNFFEGDGWDPLCAFLDRPVPSVPFPNVKPGFSAKGPSH
jgi:hypothetical protein